jgi:acyl-CoA reductase-like NAD-dependent aldehyde dehydrogenase
MVVLRGAPLAEAATGLVVGAFSNGGQTCISVERVYVEEAIYDQFAQQLVEKTSRLKLGWSKAWDVDMGSMISKAHADKVSSRVQQAIDGGARVLAGGKRRADLGPAFVEPTILANVSDAMPISREETFGPVVALYPVRSAEEAIARANDSEFGLNASVWAGGTKQAREIARQIDTGSAAINSTLLIYNSFDVPQGGIKQSGIGRRHGEHGILRYTQAQSIVGSIASGGGFDSLVNRIKNERMVRAVVAGLRIWRKMGS